MSAVRINVLIARVEYWPIRRYSACPELIHYLFRRARLALDMSLQLGQATNFWIFHQSDVLKLAVE